MTRKTTIAMVIAAGTLTFCVLAAVVKHAASPSPKDSWFTVNSDGLRQLPAGLVVLRPTHLGHSSPKIRHAHEGDSLARSSGRDVSLRDLLAEAYDCDPGNVVLPPGALQGQFDFLITVPQPREHLRGAIRKQLGYTAHHETRDTAVYKLEVADGSLPGLKTSPNSEDDDVSYTNGRLYFTHEPMSVVVRGLEDGLGEPVLDESGLTNDYDFSAPWNPRVTRAMQGGTFAQEGVQNVLKPWGLALKADTESMDMLIVEKKL